MGRVQNQGIASEVVEESWRKFQNEIISMECLGEVFQVHRAFLKSMLTQLTECSSKNHSIISQN